jgi:hypothetical protein
VEKFKLRKFWFVYIIVILVGNRIVSDFIGDLQEKSYADRCNSSWARTIKYQNEMLDAETSSKYIESGLLFTHYWTTLPESNYVDDECFNTLIEEQVNDATTSYIVLKEAENQLLNGRLVSLPELPYRLISKKIDKIIPICNNMNVVFLDFKIECDTLWNT